MPLQVSPYRSEVLKTLALKLPGRNLYDLAQKHHITILKNGKLNKGWVGQTIESVADLHPGNLQGRDGMDFELKSTSLVMQDGAWTPKETIKVTQLNPKKILEETFETSALWIKLSRLIFVGCHHESEISCKVVNISAIDVRAPSLIDPIRAFWEDVQHVIGSGEITDNFKLGTSEDLVQLRPTGDGKQWSTCPITGDKFPTRAFYATKHLIRNILMLSHVQKSQRDTSSSVTSSP